MYVPGVSSVCHGNSCLSGSLILTSAFEKVGETSTFPGSKWTLRRVAVQGQKVGKDFCVQVESAKL